MGDPNSGTDMDMIALQWARRYVTPEMRETISNEVRAQLDFLPKGWHDTIMTLIDDLIGHADIVDLAELGADLTNGRDIPYLEDYFEHLNERD